MKSRICILSVLFFSLVMFAAVQAKAINKDNRKDKKRHDHSGKNLPINTAIMALFIAGAGIGIITVKKASSGAKAI